MRRITDEQRYAIRLQQRDMLLDDLELGHGQFTLRVPSGAPRWVSISLIASTILTFGRFYIDRLSEADALEMILNATALVNG